MIEIGSIDRAQFAVIEDARGHDEVLIVARRGKYSYTEQERRMRSLLVTRAGVVLSTGYPKFDNYGENASVDAAFDRAFAQGRATFREKIDGTLIIADVIRGEVRLRTRGRAEVEWEREAFDALVERDYPTLRDRIAREPLVESHSILLEFTLADRPQVLRYDRSKLTLVGLVHKERVEPVVDLSIEEALAQRLGLELAPLVAVESPEALRSVQSSIGREGLVARFHDESGRVRMVKLKSEDYLRLHGLRARLNEPRTRQLACILDLREDEDFLRETAAFGLDWEAAQFALPLLAPLLAKKRAALALFDELKARLEPWLSDRAPSAKSAYIAALREVMASDPRFQDRAWFYAGVEWFVRPEQARMVIDAHVFNEPLARIQAWALDPARHVRALIDAPEHDGPLPT
ncbi:MAG: RNA ligase [Polyangiales bacterium]